MSSNKLSLQYRSVTYPHAENVTRICCYGHLRCTLHSSSPSNNKTNKLTRMQSFDEDRVDDEVAALSLQAEQSSSHNRNAMMRRNISEEGRLRTHQFQQTHSSSSGLTVPVQKILRFSDDSLSQSRRAETHAQTQGFRNHVRSISCVPLSKFRSPSPRNSSFNSERLADWQRTSYERLNISPNRSHERMESSPPCCSSRGNRLHTERRCERCLSAEPKLGMSDRLSPTEAASPSNRSGGSSTTGNGDARSRRSQFRRAISLFSLSCDKETERDRRDKTPQRILRPPTRYVYRRGVSGLPIECTQRSMATVS